MKPKAMKPVKAWVVAGDGPVYNEARPYSGWRIEAFARKYDALNALAQRTDPTLRVERVLITPLQGRKGGQRG